MGFYQGLSLVFAALFGLSIGSIIAQRDMHKRQLCTYSIYATSDYMMLNDKLHCKDSGKGYQLLTKPKARSIHLLEHKSEKE